MIKFQAVNNLLRVGVYLNEPIKIDELNQTSQSIDSTLVIDPAKITAIIIFESKKYISRSKHRNKKISGKCYVLIKKRHCPNGFCRISQNIRRFRKQRS